MGVYLNGEIVSPFLLGNSASSGNSGASALSSLTKTEEKLPTLSLNYCDSTEVFDSLIENGLVNDNELYFFPDPIPSETNNVALLGADGRIRDSGKQLTPEGIGAESKGAGLYSGFTEIPANADLNDYTACGYYCCSIGSVAITVSNIPSREAFTLRVSNSVGGSDHDAIDGKTWRYRMQTFTDYSGREYVRYMRTGAEDTIAFGEWKKTITNVVPSKANNVALLDTDGNLADSGEQLSSKADKKVPSTANNVALLDGTGNLVDSGKQLTPEGIGADPEGAGLYSGFTEIPANSDLNSYLTCGYYRQPVAGNGTTIANCPAQGAFTLVVSNALGYNESGDVVGKSWRYRYQRFILLGGDEYTRFVYTDGNGTVSYGDWKKILNSESGLSDLGISYGSWTPTVSGMSAYSYRKGRYVRIGDVAIVSFTFWGIMAGSSTEKIKITGCPFTTANGGYSGGGHLSGYYVSDDIVFSGWCTDTDGGIYAYGQIAGTGNKWGQSAIYQKTSGECGGGGTIMFKISD